MKNFDPILDPHLMQSIESAIMMYQKRGQWKEWGCDQIREQGNALLFYGPPGTGKTITARYIARKLKLEIEEIEMAKIGSDKPGELARAMQRLFDHARLPDKQGHSALVLIDECDTIIKARRTLGANHQWMLEVINKTLVEVRKYPGLVILATNFDEILDEALESRILKKFYFGPPMNQITRMALWKQKWPKKLPTQPTLDFLKWAASHELTGANIESLIISWVSTAMYQDAIPDLTNFVIGDESFESHESQIPQTQVEVVADGR